MRSLTAFVVLTLGAFGGESRAHPGATAQKGRVRVHHVKDSRVLVFSSTPTETRRLASKILGREVSLAQLAELVGAPNGSLVRIEDVFGEVSIETSHPRFAGPQRRALRLEDGAVVLDNQSFYLEKRGAGLGSEILRRQIGMARRLGVSKLWTCAHDDDGANGYYTWPRSGFSTTFDAETRAAFPESLREAKDMIDLMRKPGGPKYWRTHGYAMYLTFDVHRQSKSSRYHREYLAKRRTKGRFQKLFARPKGKKSRFVVLDGQDTHIVLDDTSLSNSKRAHALIQESAGEDLATIANASPGSLIFVQKPDGDYVDEDRWLSFEVYDAHSGETEFMSVDAPSDRAALVVAKYTNQERAQDYQRHLRFRTEVAARLGFGKMTLDLPATDIKRVLAAGFDHVMRDREWKKSPLSAAPVEFPLAARRATASLLARSEAGMAWLNESAYEWTIDLQPPATAKR